MPSTKRNRNRNRNDFNLNSLLGDLLKPKAVNKSKIPKWTNPLGRGGNSNTEMPRNRYNNGPIPYDWIAIEHAMSLGKFSKLKRIQFYFNKFDTKNKDSKLNIKEYNEEKKEYARNKLINPDAENKKELDIYLAEQRKLYMNKLKEHMLNQLGKNSKNTKDKVNKLEKLLESEEDEDKIYLLEENTAKLIEDLGALDKYISEWSGGGKKTRKNIRKK